MATVRTIEDGHLWSVEGQYREIFIVPLAEGGGYRLFQIAHIDDGGFRKIREWGVQPTLVDAVEKASQHSERQHG